MKTYFISSLERSNNNQRMHSTIKLIMWMSEFLLIFTVENVYSQSSIDCDSTDTCTTEWSQPETFSGNMGSGITGVITYRFRLCNGIYQFKVDDFQALDNGLFLDTLRVYHYNYTVFSDLIDLYLIQKKFAFLGIDTTYLVQTYKASCGIWLSCNYNVDTASPFCDYGIERPYPHDGISLHLPIYKWHDCGIGCCKKTYEVYKTESSTNHTIIKVNNILIERLALPECTEEWKFAKPCEVGC